MKAMIPVSIPVFLKGKPMQPITSALLAWYDRSARILPWRGIHDPYRTWVSEAMLQQTRVETVLSYYQRFLDRFPDLPSLAAADEPDVLKVWEGLGYYSRARNLLNGARMVMEQYHGIIPADPAQLRTICGIGPYMAGAIASIAFDVPVPAVDGNVIRVVSRLYGIRKNAAAPAVRREIESVAASLVPPERPGDHNQAVMDLGATICVPGTPDCERCPLSVFCDAYRTGDAPDLPVLPKARKPKSLSWTVLIIRSGNRVLLHRRTEKLLQGLWCFPMLEGFLSDSDLPARVESALRFTARNPLDRGTARHVFTHQIWEMRLFSLTADENAAAPAGYEFVEIPDIRNKALPAAMNAALRALNQ